MLTYISKTIYLAGTDSASLDTCKHIFVLRLAREC